jgi:hypothetical protein
MLMKVAENRTVQLPITQIHLSGEALLRKRAGLLLNFATLIPAECEPVMRKQWVLHSDAKSKREKCRFAGLRVRRARALLETHSVRMRILCVL